jgi:peptidoglycan/LPS O-acetylase OafA/YrhL
MQAVKPDAKLHYLPGLDIARGIAILMVLLDHGLASDATIYQSYGTRLMSSLGYILRLGHMGVHLFFILSGFLITGVLLEARTDPDYFGNFYARRALRILPAYTLILAVLFFTHNITARYVAVCLVFLANISGPFHTGNQYSALWSLSVEEQFYLVWPLAVRNLSRRALTLLCTAILVLTPALRFALLYAPSPLHDIRFKTWAVMDFFAAGALLLLATRSTRLNPLLHRLAGPLLFLGLILITLQYLLPQPTHRLALNLGHALYLEPWLLALSGLVLLLYLHHGMAHPVARPLIFLAKISYGLYLCHPYLFNLINRHWPLQPAASTRLFSQILLRFFVEAAAAIAVATLSRFTYEQFFLNRRPRPHKP